jgi:hypothetical protein
MGRIVAAVGKLHGVVFVDGVGQTPILTIALYKKLIRKAL